MDFYLILFFLTGFTGLTGFLFFATFQKKVAKLNPALRAGTNLNFEKCRKHILPQTLINWPLFIRRRRLNFLAFIRKAKNNIQ